MAKIIIWNCVEFVGQNRYKNNPLLERSIIILYFVSSIDFDLFRSSSIVEVTRNMLYVMFQLKAKQKKYKNNRIILKTWYLCFWKVVGNLPQWLTQFWGTWWNWGTLQGGTCGWNSCALYSCPKEYRGLWYGKLKSRVWGARWNQEHVKGSVLPLRQ